MRLYDGIKKKTYTTCKFIFASKKLWFQLRFLKISILIFAVKGGAKLTVSTVCELTFAKLHENFLFIVTVTIKRFVNRGKSCFRVFHIYVICGKVNSVTKVLKPFLLNTNLIQNHIKPRLNYQNFIFIT